MMTVQVWFKNCSSDAHCFSIRYAISSGFGAVQLRPSLVTSATAATGQFHNLSALDVLGSVLLYRAADSEPTAWKQLALWDNSGPPPDRLPLGALSSSSRRQFPH